MWAWTDRDGDRKRNHNQHQVVPHILKGIYVHTTHKTLIFCQQDFIRFTLVKLKIMDILTSTDVHYVIK